MSVSSVVIEAEKRSEIKPYQTMRGHTNHVRGVAHLPDGRHIITCSSDASLRLWDRESGAQIGSNWQDDGDQAPVITIALSPNGQTVASGSGGGTVKLWDVEMRKVIARWTGHTSYVCSVRWSADGMRVASGSLDGTTRVWEMESGETVLGPIKTGNRYVVAVAYSPDSSNIASGGDKAIEIWDTTTGERLSMLEQDSEVWSLAWTSDQKKLIAGFQFGSIRVFNTTTWEQIAILKGHHADPVFAISLLRNDRLLASASEDYTACLWNLDTNLPVGPPLQHHDVVWDAALSTDGRFLVTACQDKNTYVWNTHTILQEAGLEDLLPLPNINPVAHVKSIFNADATRRPNKLKVTHTAVPRGFFDDMQDGAPSSTARTDHPPAMAHTDPPNIDPPSSTTHTDPPSSAHPHRHPLAFISGARALLAHILPRFFQSQPNVDQSTGPQQHSGQPLISIHAPAHVPVAAVQPDAPQDLAQLEEPTQSRGIFGRARDRIHSFSTHSHPPSEHRRHHTSPPFSGSLARSPLSRFARRFRVSRSKSNESSQLQQCPTQPIMFNDDPTNVEVPDGRGSQSDAVPLAPSRPSQAFSDDTRDHIHSTTHLPSSIHPRRHDFTSSPRSDARTVIGRFSRRFQRSHPNMDPPIELQSRPIQDVVSDHRPTVVEVPEIRDKQALYVAPQPVRHNRRQKNTWLARFFLFICCEPRVARDASGNQ